MIETVLLYLIAFSIFVVLQSLFINGVHESFKGEKLVDGISKKVFYQGMILYMMFPEFIELNKHKWWSKPLFSCVKCMSSFWGTVTFLPLAIYLFKFHVVEIFILIFDIFILLTLNWYLYKKL